MSLVKIANKSTDMKKTAQQSLEIPLGESIVFVPDSGLSIDDEDILASLLEQDEKEDGKEDEKEDKDKDKDKDEDDEPAAELRGEGEVLIQVGDEEPIEKEFLFTLPLVPGGDSQDEIVVDEDDEDTHDLRVSEDDVNDEDIEVEEPDAWDWKARGLENFPQWLNSMFHAIPRHSGYDTVGIERAIAYLEALDRIISKAVRTDLRGVLDMSYIEKARHEIRTGVSRLKDRLDNINKNSWKKKSEESPNGFVKEAQKITGVKGVMVTVPLLVSRIARTCINGMVSAGHDIEDLFKRQVEEYSLTKREQAEVMQLIEDMGYPMRRDRIFSREDKIDTTSTDNGDWAANYPA